MNNCPTCGVALKSDELYCHACGTRVSSQVCTGNQKSNPQKNGTKCLETMNLISVVLFVAAIISLIGGLVHTERTKYDRVAAKVQIEVVDMVASYDPDAQWGNKNYCITMTYRITNNSSTTIDEIGITSYVTNSSGRQIIQLESSFGSYSNYLNLEKHSFTMIDVSYQENNLDNNSAYSELFESHLSELSFDHQVTSIRIRK